MKRPNQVPEAARAASPAPAPPNREKGLIDVGRAVRHAIVDGNETYVMSLSHADAQAALDYVWMLLGFSPEMTVRDVPKIFQTPEARNSLRRLALALALKYDMYPAALVLKGVICKEQEGRGLGGFADVYFGTLTYAHVALKRLRRYGSASEEQRIRNRHSFYRESMLWKHLDHKHVLPFRGVSEDVFLNTICMVLPWMPNGSIRHYIPKLRKEGKLLSQNFTESVDNWLLQTALGLTYLHQEGVVHGDLHAGNILVNSDGTVCLSDFGMALIAEAAFQTDEHQQVVGAMRWLAPELIDPEEFGLQSGLPTYSSDVYSFGCTIVELYTGQVPFPHLHERTVPLRVMKGIRPARPVRPAISNDMWTLTNSCWSHWLKERPDASEVAKTLGEIVSQRSTPPIVSSEQFSSTLPEQALTVPERIKSPEPTDSFAEIMAETPQTPAEKERFFSRALKEGEQQMKLGPAYYSKAAQVLHRAVLAYPRPPDELLMIYRGRLPPPVFQLVKDMMK